MQQHLIVTTKIERVKRWVLSLQQELQDWHDGRREMVGFFSRSGMVVFYTSLKDLLQMRFITSLEGGDERVERD